MVQREAVTALVPTQEVGGLRWIVVGNQEVGQPSLEFEGPRAA